MKKKNNKNKKIKIKKIIKKKKNIFTNVHLLL